MATKPKAGAQAPAATKRAKASTGVVAKSSVRRKSYALGYWADGTTPDLSHALKAHCRVQSFDADVFTRWLGKRLEAYRGGEELRKQLPSPAEEVEYLMQLQRWLKRTHAEADATLQSLAEPPTVAARLHLAAFQANVNWAAMRDTVRLTLLHMSLVVDRVQSKVGTTVLKAGRPKSAPVRDALVAAVVAKLTSMAPKVSQKAHQLTAQQVLKACEVAGVADIKRAARRGQ